MKMKRLFARIAVFVIVLCTFMPCLPMFAADISVDAYPGALSVKEFEKKYPRLKPASIVSDHDESVEGHTYAFMFTATPYEDAYYTAKIDSITVDVEGDGVEIPTKKFSYNVATADGDEFPVNGTVDARCKILFRYVQEPLEDYIQGMKDIGYKETTYQGMTAYELIECEGDLCALSYVRGQSHSIDRTIRIILLDDTHLRQELIMELYSYAYISNTLAFGGDAADIMTPVWEKAEECWKKDIIPAQEEMFQELFSNASVKLTRTRVYEGELGVNPKDTGENDEKADETKNKDKQSVIIDTEAESTSGEASYTVPAMIITGVVAAGAAIAVAGVTGAGKSGKTSEEDKPQSTYKMYISKDFGNKIRYNRQGVQVNARMVEIKPGGTEVDRPDLTQNISITSGRNVNVESGVFTGGFMCALVSCTGASGADNPRDGVVSFTFSGEGGTFTNNVTFELIGEPRVDVTDELKMIYGDGKRYDVNIELVDFLAPAENITFNYGKSPVEAEAEKLDDAHYTLHISNNSQKPEETFFATDSMRFEVTADNGKESATEGIVGTLMPEGLSVKRRNDTVLEDERFVLKCFENTDEDGEKDIPITRISFIIAIPETDENGAAKVKCPVVTEDMFTFAPMTADDTRYANIANNAQCVFTMNKNASASDSIVTYEIQPKRQIPQEAEKKYDITLPVRCECEGNTYTLDVPVRAIGDKLQAEMQAKEKEKALLKVRIRRYLDPDEVAVFLAGYETKVQNMSAYDIRLMSMSLVFMSQNEAYEARWQGLKANMLDWAQWGAEWVKWAGDQAFSMLMSYYGGPQYGPILDSVLSPAKDIICEELGTCLDQWYSGKDVTGVKNKFEKYSQTVLVMMENCLSNSIDGKTDVKKAGSLLAAYCALRFLNHVMFDDKGMYDAVLATFGDMTAQAFKFTAGMSLEKYIGNPSNKDKIGAVVYNWIKSRMPEGVDGMGSDDVIRKYIEETAAMLGGKVSSEAADVYNSYSEGVIVIPIKFNIGNADGETESFRDYTVAIDPIASLVKLKDFLFEQLFNMFTFATSPMKMPSDAKYYPQA